MCRSEFPRFHLHICMCLLGDKTKERRSFCGMFEFHLRMTVCFLDKYMFSQILKCVAQLRWSQKTSKIHSISLHFC